MRPILPVLGLLSALWLFGGTWWLSRQVCGTTPVQTLSVTDGTFNTTAQGLIAFNRSDDTPLQSGDTQKSFKEIVGHMAENPDRMLMLSGLFGSQEKYDGELENLGVARAESIKAVLVGLEANPERISTSGTRLDNLTFTDNRVEQAVNFAFGAMPTPSETSTTTSDVSNNIGMGNIGQETFSLTFESGQTEYDATSDLNEYIGFLRAYLNNHPDARVEVIGHTDKGGSEKEMKSLSLKRAKNVRRILRNNSIKSNEVRAFGEGYNQPVVSHDDADAIVKNNRVIIRIKE